MLKVFDNVPKLFGRLVKGYLIIIVCERRDNMNLGENIFNLRKKKGLSQEQLGEYINVTRQTISNWELGETTPNPEQLKLLSKTLNVSTDELLDNDIKGVLEEKISNTEKLAGLIIKILKAFVVFIGVLFVIEIIAFILYNVVSDPKIDRVESSATTICKIDDKEYEIEFGTDNYFLCENCSDDMIKDLKKIVDFNNIDNSLKNINDYFKSKNGSCD